MYRYFDLIDSHGISADHVVDAPVVSMTERLQMIDQYYDLVRSLRSVLRLTDAEQYDTYSIAAETSRGAVSYDFQISYEALQGFSGLTITKNKLYDKLSGGTPDVLRFECKSRLPRLDVYFNDCKVYEEYHGENPLFDNKKYVREKIAHFTDLLITEAQSLTAARAQTEKEQQTKLTLQTITAQMACAMF